LRSTPREISFDGGITQVGRRPENPSGILPVGFGTAQKGLCGMFAQTRPPCPAQ
jgi:hypothetical protein